MELVYGKVPGFESYRVDRPIIFDYILKPTDFPITESLLQQFKKFAADKYGISPTLVDQEKEFISRNLRSELVTAAYGMTTSFQVANEYDNQLKQAIETLPQAKQLLAASLEKKDAGMNR